MLFDTHTRLTDSRFPPGELPRIIPAAREVGVGGALVVGTSLESSRRAIQIAERLAPEWDAWAAVGVYPPAAASVNEETITALHRMGQARRVRAVAAGLDLVPGLPPRRVQEAALEALLQVAQWLDLPVVLHSGSAGAAAVLVPMLQARRELLSSGWVHDFNDGPETLEAVLGLGLSIGVSGRITDRREGARVRELLPTVPVERLLIETDAPAHPPKPHHLTTDRSEPAFLPDVLKEVAHLRHTQAAPLAEAVTRNARRLLRLEEP
jgi:TatD DNase family protein